MPDFAISTRPVRLAQYRVSSSKLRFSLHIVLSHSNNCTSSSRPRNSMFEAMWVWQLTKPGITTAPFASIRFFAVELSRPVAGPRSVMLLPLIFRTPFCIVAPPPIGRMVALTMTISAGRVAGSAMSILLWEITPRRFMDPLYYAARSAVVAMTPKARQAFSVWDGCTSPCRQWVDLRSQSARARWRTCEGKSDNRDLAERSEAGKSLKRQGTLNRVP